MGTKIRVEVGDRVVEIVAGTRTEALKAFKFAIRGVFPVSVKTGCQVDSMVVRWRVARIGLYAQIVDENGAELPEKINAIKQLREVTGLGLAESKRVVECGIYNARDIDDERRVREALKSYVCFVA